MKWYLNFLNFFSTWNFLIIYSNLKIDVFILTRNKNWGALRKKIVKKKLIDDKNIHADDKDEGKLTQSIRIVTTWKVSKYGVFSGPYFLAFGLNTEIYGINLRIQSECEKILNRKTSVFRHFLRSVYCDRIDPLDTGCKLNIHIT